MGRDKAALPAGSTTLAGRTAALLSSCTDPVVELGPGRSGLPSIADTGGGPLSALASAGACWAGLPADGHVLVVATDLPRLTSTVLAWLAGHPSPGAVIPDDGTGLQPLCARYPVAALRRLANDPPSSPRLLDWVATLDPRVAGPREWAGVAGDPLVLRDADTPAELAALTRGRV